MITLLAVRVVQLVMAGVVLGLSAVMVNNYGAGHAPSILAYGAFCGGVAIIVAEIGIVATFLNFLQGVIMLVLDGLVTFFLLAGGLAFAIKSGVGDCKSDAYLTKHANVFAPSETKYYPGVGDDEKKQIQHLADDTRGRCRMVQADTAFVWFLFALFVGTTIMVFLHRSGKRGGAIV